MRRFPNARTPATSADMANRVGNDQLKAIHDNKDRLAQADRRLAARRDLIVQRRLPGGIS